MLLGDYQESTVSKYPLQISHQNYRAYIGVTIFKSFLWSTSIFGTSTFFLLYRDFFLKTVEL